MADWGIKYFGFLITVHTLFFFGMQAGMVDSQGPDNPHKQFLDNFNDTEAQRAAENAGVSSDSGIIESTFSPVLAQSNFFQQVSGWVLSPYNVVGAAELPPMLELLLNALMGFMDVYLIYKAVRGGF